MSYESKQTQRIGWIHSIVQSYLEYIIMVSISQTGDYICKYDIIPSNKEYYWIPFIKSVERCTVLFLHKYNYMHFMSENPVNPVRISQMCLQPSPTPPCPPCQQPSQLLHSSDV